MTPGWRASECASASRTYALQIVCPLTLQRALVRNHLAHDDVGVELHRLVSRRADLDVMAALRQSERLRSRREHVDRARALSVDPHFSSRRRDLETHASHVLIRRLHLDASGLRWV